MQPTRSTPSKPPYTPAGLPRVWPSTTGWGALTLTLARDLTRRSPLCLAQRYELQEQLGRGAFGAVFRARRRSDGAAVCVKVLPGGSWGGQDGMVSKLRRRHARLPAGRPPSVSSPPPSGTHRRSRRFVRCASCATPTWWPSTTSCRRAEPPTSSWSSARQAWEAALGRQ
jgi:hypothetical protein